MSVIVKGMEMPNTCEECQESCEIGSNLFCLVTNDGNKWGWKKSDVGFYMRPDWCPLRPLPVKHGRLIDASELETVAKGRLGVINIGHIDEARTIVEAEGDD